MGMTIDEATKIFRKEIECLSHTKCEDCILEKACDPMNTTPFDTEYIEAYGIAIETMRKFQKIRQIIEADKYQPANTYVCGGVWLTDEKRVSAIREVEDGNDG